MLMEDDIQEIRNTNTKGAVCSSFLFAVHFIGLSI